MSQFPPKILFVLLLLGCNAKAPSTGDSADAQGGETPRETCDVTVSSTIPARNTMDHYYRDPIVFKLSGPIEEATVITDVAGETSLSEDGETVTFTPTGGLSPSTEYTMGLDYCYDGQPEITFSTSHFGAPLEASGQLEGQTYVLNFEVGEYIIGENAGDLLNSVFTRNILVQFEEVYDISAQVLIAIGKPNATTLDQDKCARTIPMDVSIGTLPLITGREESFTFGAMGGQLRFDSINFEGTISSDLSALGGLTYHASMGIAGIVDILDEFGGEEVGCDLAENLGIPCEPCVNEPDANCITIAAKGISGTHTEVDLEVITDAGTHPDCDAGD